MKVLVTGASGRIGQAFAHANRGGPLELVRADLEDREPDLPFPFLRLDVTDRDACLAACHGVDAVVHLAADPDPEADLRTRVLPLNLVGTLNMADAAVEAGARRFVYASSGQAVLGYPSEDYPIPADALPRPVNDYGAGKAAGEAFCAAYAARSRTSFVSVRLGAFAPRPLPQDTATWKRAAWLSDRDAGHLLTRCVLASFDGAHVVNGVSANHPARLDLTSTRALLGYEPADDGFADAAP